MESTDKPPVRVESFDLELCLMGEDVPLEGRATLHVKNVAEQALRAITLYLHPELKVEAVHGAQGQALPFETEIVAYFFNYTTDARAVRVTLSSDLRPNEGQTLTVLYHGTLSRNAIRSPSDGYYHVDAGSAYMRDYGYCLWHPTVSSGFDGLKETATYRLKLDVPEAWRPLAFGLLDSESVAHGRNLSSWRTERPVEPTLIAVAAEPWQVSGTDAYRIYHYPEPESVRAAQAYARVVKPLRETLHRQFGADLPLRPYTLAELRGHPTSAYATPNAVGLPSKRFARVLEEEQLYSQLNWLGHEMAHEYVCVPAVPDAPGAYIVTETFPCYLYVPALTDVLGPSFRRYYVQRAWSAYERGLRGEATDEDGQPLPELPLSHLTAESYRYKDRFLVSDKAVLLFYRLEQMLGQAAFLGATHRFLSAHRTVPATLGDYEACLAEAAGRSLRAFFHRWFETTEPLPREWREPDL